MVTTLAGRGEPGVRDGGGGPGAVLGSVRGRDQARRAHVRGRRRRQQPDPRHRWRPRVHGGRRTVARDTRTGRPHARGSIRRRGSPSRTTARSTSPTPAITASGGSRPTGASRRWRAAACPGLRDGPGTEAQFNGPIGIAIAAGRPAARPAAIVDRPPPAVRLRGTAEAHRWTRRRVTPDYRGHLQRRHSSRGRRRHRHDDRRRERARVSRRRGRVGAVRHAVRHRRAAGRDAARRRHRQRRRAPRDPERRRDHGGAAADRRQQRRLALPAYRHRRRARRHLLRHRSPRAHPAGAA